MSDDATPLERGDCRLIESLRHELRPEAPSQAEQVAFRAALEERLQRRGGRAAWPLAAAAAGALALAALWFALPADEAVVEGEPSTLLAYAYYETDYLALENEPGILPAEYRALAAAFDVN